METFVIEVPDCETLISTASVTLRESSFAFTATIYLPSFVGVHVAVFEVDDAFIVVPSLQRNVYFTVPLPFLAVALSVTALFGTAAAGAERVTVRLATEAGRSVSAPLAKSFLELEDATSPEPVGYCAPELLVKMTFTFPVNLVGYS